MGSFMGPQVSSFGEWVNAVPLKWELRCQERDEAVTYGAVLAALGLTTSLSLRRQVKAGVTDSVSLACGCWLKPMLRLLKEKQ